MSESREFRRRLEAQRGGGQGRDPRAPGASIVTTETGLSDCPSPLAPITYRRDLPRLAESTPPAFCAPGEPVALDQALPGREVALPGFGAVYLVETPLSRFGQHRAGLGNALMRQMQAQDSPLHSRMARHCGVADVAASEIVLFDIETTGLANAPLFLVGMLGWHEGELVARQYLARHYGEEAGVTALFVEEALRRRVLVSFNGKTFDLPTLRVRAAVHRVPWPAREPAHFDLLHESRRVWRDVLPNCRLQTLEQHVCGRPPRCGDIPGSEIPAAYHRFVHTADAGQLQLIVQHNLLDLVTLAELMLRLPAERG